VNYKKQVREDKPKISITKRNEFTNFNSKPEQEKEYDHMDKKLLRKKLEGKLLKAQEESLKAKSLKQLIQEYYVSKKASKPETPVKETVKTAPKTKKTLKEEPMNDESDFVSPTNEEAPVDDEMNLEGEGDLDLEGEGDEFNLEGEGDEDFDFDDEGDEDFDFGDEDEGEFDLEGEGEGEEHEGAESDEFEAGEEEGAEEGHDEGEGGEGEESELDSEIGEEEKAPEMTEAQKKKIRMERMKAKAIAFAKKVKEDAGAKAFDPSEGVDATLAGNTDLFNAIPDIDNAGTGGKNTVPGDELGTQDASTPPNISMEKTDAPKWNTDGAPPAQKGINQEPIQPNPKGPSGAAKESTDSANKPWNAITRKVEKLNYRALLRGDYWKK
jgi:hypothetical protein